MAELHFAYHRAVAPMMWVLVAIATIELVVVHFLIAFWSPLAALSLSVATLIGIGWLVGIIRSMRGLPVLLDGERLVMRVGRLRCVTIPLASVAGLSSAWTAEALKAKDVLNLALIAYPNVVVDLAAPIGSVRRRIRAVAHRRDDPQAFADALATLIAADIRR